MSGPKLEHARTMPCITPLTLAMATQQPPHLADAYNMSYGSLTLLVIAGLGGLLAIIYGEQE